MAFDLNKNDGSNNKTSSSDKSSSKFDLSKSDTKVSEPVLDTTYSSEPTKSKTWIYVLVGVIVLLGAWYILSNSKNAPSDNTVKAVDTAAKPQTSAIDTVAKIDTSKAQVSPENNGNGAAATDKASPTEEPKSKTVNKPQVKDLGSLPAKQKESSAVSDNTLPSGDVKLSKKVPAAFAKGSTSIQRLNKSVIKEILARLNKNTAETITINGYASSEGALPTNVHISELRAIAFKNYLISKGIPESRIVTVAKGIEDPIASNDNEEGRNQNRRVEFSIN